MDKLSEIDNDYNVPAVSGFEEFFEIKLLTLIFLSGWDRFL